MTHTVKTFKSFAWNHLSKLSEYGLTYLFGIYLARKIGAEGYSIYVTLMSLASFSMILGGLGFDETVNKYVSQLSIQKQIGSIKYLIKSLIKLRTVILLFIILIIVLLKNEIAYLLKAESLASYLIILCVYILFQSLVNLFANIFIAENKTQTVFIINFLTKATTLLIGILLLESGYGLYEIFILLAVMIIISFLSYFLVGRKYYRFKKAIRFNITVPLKFGVTTWGNMLLTFLMGKNSNVLILSFLMGTSPQISFYEIAFSLTQLIEYIFSIGFMGVALASFSSLAVTDFGKLKNLRSSVTKYLQLFVLPLSIFVLFYAEFVVTTVFSNQYRESVPLLRAFLIFTILSVSFLGSGANTAVLFAIGKERVVFLIHLIFGVINILLIILFVPESGIFWAMIITGACLFSTVLSEFIFATRKIGIVYDFRFLFKIVLISTLALLVTYLIGRYLINNDYINLISYFAIIFSGYLITGIANKEVRLLMSQTKIDHLNK